jgi:hypothetical protein
LPDGAQERKYVKSVIALNISLLHSGGVSRPKRD